MSYYTNRIDEKLVGKRRTSKLKKQLAATQKELANTKIYHSAAQDVINKLNRREDRDAPSNKPREKSYISFHSPNRDDLGGKLRKIKSGEVIPVGNYSVGDRSRLRKMDATVRGSDTQQATGSGNRARRRMKAMGIIEAIYNSFVDMAYVICENQTRVGKGRLIRPAEASAPGKVFRRGRKGVPGDRTTVVVKPTHLTGPYGDNDKDPERVRARIQGNINKDNPTASTRTPGQRLAKHYKGLHKRAEKGDKRALALLNRAHDQGF